MAEQLTGGSGDDSDVEVADEHHDFGAGVDPADSDVVETGVVAQGDDTGLVDAVVSDAVVGSAACPGRAGLGEQPVDDGGGAAS